MEAVSWQFCSTHEYVTLANHELLRVLCCQVLALLHLLTKLLVGISHNMKMKNLKISGLSNKASAEAHNFQK